MTGTSVLDLEDRVRLEIRDQVAWSPSTTLNAATL